MRHHPTHRPKARTAALAATLTAAALAGALVAPTPASAAGTTYTATGRASVASDGSQLPAGPYLGSIVELDETGRYVFFGTSQALAPNDDNDTWDVYVRDRRSSTTTLVSVGTDGRSFSQNVSRLCGASSTGRFVGFYAPLHDGDDSSTSQVWIIDRTTDETEMVSVTSGGVRAGNGGDSGMDVASRCPISTDGRYVTFANSSSTLSPNSHEQIFRRDRTGKLTLIESMSSASVVGNGPSRFPDMTDDGNQIAFQSTANNLVAGDGNGHSDVFVRTVGAASLERASLTDGDAQVADGDSHSPSIAGDGRYVTFVSAGSGLTAGEAGTFDDVYLRDLQTDATELVSMSSTEVQSDGYSFAADISPDGRFVAFASGGKDLYPAKVSNNADVFLRDRQLGSTTLVSRTAGISPGNDDSWEPVVSANGKVVAFTSDATDLVRKDTNGRRDVFARDTAADFGPLPSMDNFIEQQYQDFFGRASTSAERTEWKARLTNGEQSSDSAIVAFAHSSTWSARRAPLVRLYWAFFLRTPDEGGLDYWVGRLEAGWSLARVAKQFAASSEFQAKYGTKSNSQFVTLIYQNIFDRDPDAGGLAYWTKKLDTKAKTRGDVMVNFSESSEGKRRLAPQTDVVLINLGMLGAMPTKGVLEAWRLKIGLGATAADFADAVRVSPAYSAHVT
ncbi:MAG: DUF4214 domain-containing protein [Acidimicrobiales bacterium]